MFDTLAGLTLLIGFGFYLYVAWISAGAAPRSAKAAGNYAAWTWVLAGGAALYAWLWGATRGLSAYQTFILNSTPGKLQNWVGTVGSLAIVAACFSIHALVASLVNYGRGADIDS